MTDEGGLAWPPFMEDKWIEKKRKLSIKVIAW